ncbi:MAG: long-chain fatty acid--CoA ligase, partial [Gemmatimonadetes bacterium]|nr:long-chain fatty acid--CoA ligase [Gemmatimonadota bacterium]
MADTIDYFANKADVPQGTLVQLFFRTANRFADNPAYNVTGAKARTYTYAQVRDVARRGAAALARSGVGRGERAAILSENRVEWALADWSCLCAGVVDVPIYSTLPAAQVAYILKDSGASLVFVSDAEQLAKAREAVTGLGREVEIVVFDEAAALEG